MICIIYSHQYCLFEKPGRNLVVTLNGWMTNVKWMVEAGTTWCGIPLRQLGEHYVSGSSSCRILPSAHTQRLVLTRTLLHLIPSFSSNHMHYLTVISTAPVIWVLSPFVVISFDINSRIWMNSTFSLFVTNSIYSYHSIIFQGWTKSKRELALATRGPVRTSGCSEEANCCWYYLNVFGLPVSQSMQQ